MAEQSMIYTAKKALGLENILESDDDFLLVVVILLVVIYYIYYKISISMPTEAKEEAFIRAPGAVQVRIQWCGGCGFQDKFEEAQLLIENQYGDLDNGKKVVVLSVRDPGITGNFEIKVNGELVHSMKTKRHGFMHNNPERISAVFGAIDSALKNA